MQRTAISKLRADDEPASHGCAIAEQGTAVLAMLRDYLLPRFRKLDACCLAALEAQASTTGKITLTSPSVVHAATPDAGFRHADQALRIFTGAAPCQDPPADPDSASPPMRFDDRVTSVAPAFETGRRAVAATYRRSPTKVGERQAAARATSGSCVGVPPNALRSTTAAAAFGRTKAAEARPEVYSLVQRPPARDVDGRARPAAATSILAGIGTSLRSIGRCADRLERCARATAMRTHVANLGEATPPLETDRVARAPAVARRLNSPMELRVSPRGETRSCRFTQHVLPSTPRPSSPLAAEERARLLPRTVRVLISTGSWMPSTASGWRGPCPR